MLPKAAALRTDLVQYDNLSPFYVMKQESLNLLTELTRKALEKKSKILETKVKEIPESAVKNIRGLACTFLKLSTITQI